MENLLRAFFSIMLGTLVQTNTAVTLMVSIPLLVVYLYFKKHDIRVFSSSKIRN